MVLSYSFLLFKSRSHSLKSFSNLTAWFWFSVIWAYSSALARTIYAYKYCLICAFSLERDSSYAFLPSIMSWSFSISLWRRSIWLLWAFFNKVSSDSLIPYSLSRKLFISISAILSVSKILSFKSSFYLFKSSIES
jgi:hypothetical protein